MKKIAFVGMMVAMSVVGLSVSAQNGCPSIAPYLCNSGSCTNDPNVCNQSWGGGVNTSNSPALPSGGSSSNLSTVANSGERCSGNLRYNEADAQACADLAESQGATLGYDIQCTTGERDEFIVVNSNITGTQKSYQPTCTINGVPGFGAQSLVGYTGSGPGYSVYDPFYGSTTVYGSGYNINPMWYSLPCSLVDAAEGRAGTLVGAATCTSGASSYFGTSNPSTWTQTNRPPASATNPPRSTTGANTGAGAGGTISSNNPLLNIINQLLQSARALYGSSAQSGAATQSSAQSLLNAVTSLQSSAQQLYGN